MLRKFAYPVGPSCATDAEHPVGRVRYTSHAQERVEERSGLTRSEVEDLLEQGKAVYLGDNKTEGRSYFLFCSPKTNEFFVAVASVECRASTTWIITILDRAMHERDRGLLSAHELERAARLALGDDAFNAWFARFDIASRPINPKTLSLKFTYAEPDGSVAEATLHPIAPVASSYFSGGNLHLLRDCSPFWRWANRALYQMLGQGTASALSSLQGIELCYGSSPVAQFLTASDRSILPQFHTRFHRSDITLFVTFALDCKLHQVQKNSPSIPIDLLYEDMLPQLGTELPLLCQIKSHLAKKVAPEALQAAIRGITEIQLHAPGGVCVDLISEHDRSIVDRLQQVV